MNLTFPLGNLLHCALYGRQAGRETGKSRGEKGEKWNRILYGTYWTEWAM